MAAYGISMLREEKQGEREKKKFVITKNMGGVGWVGCFAVFGGKFIE